MLVDFLGNLNLNVQMIKMKSKFNILLVLLLLVYCIKFKLIWTMAMKYKIQRSY